MKNNIKMTIHKIKAIYNAEIEIPFESGLYALVGNNGTGKSTIIYCLAQLINKKSLSSFGVDFRDGDSYLEFEYGSIKNRWEILQDAQDPRKIYMPTPKNQIRINGMYEGSLFYGFRFQNYNKVKNLMDNGDINIDLLCDADQYIVEQLGYILHGDKSYYMSYELKRIKNKELVRKMDLNETPYFMTKDNSLISQYAMSSGECITLSLLHFIYHSIIRRSLDEKLPALMLIDEIELTLHPVAISRLLELLQSLVQNRENLIIIITSHAPEVINKIDPKNIFLLELNPTTQSNSLTIINPCYPAYAIRDVYRHDGFDWLLLVEDELSKIIVKSTIDDLNLSNSKLLHIVPVGGWSNTLKLQYDLLANNVLGVGKHIISILDGDIKNECNKKPYKSMEKLFLPIASTEKYLKKVLIDEKNNSIYKKINDDLFPIESLKDLLNDYKNTYKDDPDGKKLYNLLIKNAAKRQITQSEFVFRLSKIIKENVDFSDFCSGLTRILK